jgi:predicted methyltransferase
MKRPSRTSAAFLVLVSALGAAIASPPDPALEQAVADSDRSPKLVARDRSRHPVEELTFFGLKPTMTVVEVWPGGGYWTEILGPYLKNSGRYYAAIPVTGESKEESAGVVAWKARFGDKARYGSISITEFGAGHFEVAPPGSADLILTFRNLHNWMNAGYADQALKAFFTALKPGGILGMEGHRGRDDQQQDPKAKSGYVRQDYAIELARKAGFELVGSSEINANPKDTKDWPEGVWTLPPTLTLGEKDRAKYVAIGEADNFVLKFRKPMH